MKSIVFVVLCLCSVSLMASPVSRWKQAVKRGKLYEGVVSVESGIAREISASREEYPEDYAFPTNAPMYWKKSGADIVAMTPAEQDVVNGNAQQEVLELATEDAISDALIAAIAEAIKQNAKTYDEVKAIFKGKVDPKKADKKSKGPKK
jgi:hypothetical protein